MKLCKYDELLNVTVKNQSKHSQVSQKSQCCDCTKESKNNYYLRHFNDFRDVEISRHGRQTFTDQIRFIRLESVHLMSVLFRVDGHTAYSHLGACPEHANCYLT